MSGSAWTIRDAAASCLVAGSLIVVAVPTLSQVRMDSMRQACNGNYRFIYGSTESYSNDNAGFMWALNWKRGMQNPDVPWQSFFSTDTEAQGTQAGLILRRLANLTPTQSPIPVGWMAPLLYTHTALLDYVNLPIPASYVVCPGDSQRIRFVDGDFRNAGSINWRAPYSSSYMLGTSHWGPSRQTIVSSPTNPAVNSPIWYPSSSDISFWNHSGDSSALDVYRPRQWSEVRYPANKVFLWDEYARHSGKPRYHAYQTAAQDLLFYDGSVRYFRTDSTNPGWDPSSSSRRGNMRVRFAFTKYPDFFGGLDNNAQWANFPAGWYRWTRGGLYGWDVPRLSSMRGKLPSSTVTENELDTSPATGTW